jgi:hypothetical protein
MTVKALIKELCKREKLKKQVDIAQVTEIVGHLSDLLWEECKSGVAESKMLGSVLMNGKKREMKKLKKASKK